MSNIMSRNTGSLENRETNTLDMPLQIYAISKDLARYIAINSPILHKYANEDVSLGSWFIGLEVKHIDDRNMCCGTRPDCHWKLGKHKLEMYVVLHLIGVAVAFANPWKESSLCMNTVGREIVQCGAHFSE